MTKRMSVFSFVICLLLARMAIRATGYLLFVYPIQGAETHVDAGLSSQPSPTDSDGQRDLERTGQVVRRGGKLVVMLDDTDPDNEVYRLLNPADADAFLFGMDPIWPSLGLGTLVFVGFATGTRVFAAGRSGERG
jgi:hypothetical protein